MPTYQRLWLEDDCGSEQRGKQSIEPDKDQSICGTQSEPWWRRSPQDEKLVAKEHDLGFATGTRSEQSNEPSTEKFDEVDHPGNATALLRLSSPDQIFGRHNDKCEMVDPTRSATKRMAVTAIARHAHSQGPDFLSFL